MFKKLLVVMMLSMLVACSHGKVVETKPWVDLKPIAEVEAPVVQEVCPLMVADIRTAIFFGWDSIDIPMDEFHKLLDIKNQMDENPDTVLFIDGYASKEGSEEYNFEISDERANTVRMELIALGVPADRIIYAIGQGETDEFDKKFFMPNRRVMVISLANLGGHRMLTWPLSLH